MASHFFAGLSFAVVALDSFFFHLGGGGWGEVVTGRVRQVLVYTITIEWELA